MAYAFRIGLRYLRSVRRSTVSVITFVAVAGVALGVAALLAVLSITSGFQKEFRDKVLGVNADVLVLKYGLDFDEYRDVMARADRMPEVVKAAPFVINEMMLAKGDRLSNVLVKGVDPKLMPKVLDLPQQVIRGSLKGLRRPGARPPSPPEDLSTPTSDDDLDAMLQGLARPRPGGKAEADREAPAPPSEAPPPAAPPPGHGARGRLPEVKVASPSQVEAALQKMGDQQPALPDDQAESEILSDEKSDVQEEKESTSQLPGIVVGVALAKNLGLHVGDRVKVISPLTGIDVSMWSPDSRVPRSRDFRVIAVFEAGFQEYDSRLVYVDLYAAERFFDRGDSVTGVEMRVHNIDKASAVANKLERELDGPYHTMDWEELNHNLFTALAIQKVMLSLVIASIIIVAAFNVVATLIMVVLDKKREIAILKAMGATDLSVLMIFLVQGVVIGVVGTVLGLFIGGGLIWYLHVYHFPLDPKVYLIDHLPVVVNAPEFAVTVVVALGICLVATLVPSWWAARLLPADGVRYE